MMGCMLVPPVSAQHLDKEVAQMLLEGAKVPVVKHAGHARLQWAHEHSGVRGFN